MIFTVELRGGIETTFRLQTNGNWRRLDRDYSLQPDDFKSTDPAEVTSRTPYGTEVEIENVVYKVSPTIEHIGRALAGDSLVFRDEFPTVLPSKEQLRTVLFAGDDDHHNVLILNLHGQFELRPRPPFDHLKNDPTVVLRHETFASGGDYVGPEAAGDSILVDRLFSSSLEGWFHHLKAGITQEYVDVPASKSVDEILEDIESLKGQWIAPH